MPTDLAAPNARSEEELRPAQPPSQPEDATISQLEKLFIERRDVFAEQHSNGSYAPVRRPVRLADLKAHVSGKHTYGHYLLSPEGNCRLLAFDIDVQKESVTTWRNNDDELETFDPRCCVP